jgi:ABC-type dipeptide/oligopeptide/nickel transport system permease component
LTLDGYPMAVIAHITGTEDRDRHNQEDIRTDWSKGLRDAVIVDRHVPGDALLPVITVSLRFGGALDGAGPVSHPLT